jgi:mannose-1-phosphate guanylyltransferase/mannose-1-phosphate guanylyltransferase/mannose-6-phosphate isomerase
MIPVILSGGSGTRLWPVSRASYPKQFCEFYDRSFLQNTIDRSEKMGTPFLLTVKSMEGLSVRMAKQNQIPSQNVLLEPMARNTAPAVALLCHVLAQRGLEKEVVGLFPSDHLITDEETFHQALTLAERVAKEGKIVTLGIAPFFPATGYGYIQKGNTAIDKEGSLSAFALQAFKEKPNSTKATEYLNSGEYFWNAGIFIFSVEKMIQLFQELQPQMWEKITRIALDLSNAEYHYALLPSISLDYAIMEKSSNNAVIPCDIGWSDVGSWDEVARLAEESSSLQSGSQAQIFSLDSENNYVFSVTGKVVGMIGIKDTIVVETPDALLLTKRSQSQSVKDLVDQLKEAKLPQATDHPFEMRPWGRFEILADDALFKAKKITVDPGAQLSYQSHDQRSEHWVVVAGEGEIVLNDSVKTLRPGESIFIPAKAKHRMRNPGTQPLIFVEVQTGAYFGEDDIVRYQDDYRRPVQGEP